MRDCDRSGRSGGRALVLGLLTLFFGVVATGCFSAQPPPPNGSPTPGEPWCETNPSQIVVLGDSYVNWVTHTFPQDLANLAGETYRMYAVGGASLGSGGITTPIPDQANQAFADDPDIRAVVMDGGGNDILIPDTVQFPGSDQCKNELNAATDPVCQAVVQKALDAATALMNQAASYGVRDVVYFFYPHVPEGTLIGGAHPDAILDYALPKAKALCDSAVTRTNGLLRCHFVDTVPIFQGHPDWFASGDIHENSTGSKAIAQAVYQTMVDNCIAQPASSGCCEPK